MSRYFDEMKRSMEWLATQERTLFLGQAVGSPGTFMYGTVADIEQSKRLEVPVAEQFQMQMALGLALNDTVPVAIFPRQNFLLLALGDLVNMIDKLPAMSNRTIVPHIIIRTAAGTTAPIHPGHQHVGNFANAFRSLLDEVNVIELTSAEQIFPAYEKAYFTKKPSLLIEFGDLYSR